MGQSSAHFGSADMNLLQWLIAAFFLAAAGCLLIGFLTPIAAVIIGLGAIASLALLDPSNAVVGLIVLAAAIALLGPGAFSVDARVFGRREIMIPSATRSSKINSKGSLNEF